MIKLKYQLYCTTIASNNKLKARYTSVFYLQTKKKEMVILDRIVTEQRARAILLFKLKKEAREAIIHRELNGNEKTSLFLLKPQSTYIGRYEIG